MRHIFTKLFALLIMAAMSMGVMASTVDDLVAIDCDYVFIADDVTANGTVKLTANTLYADGHIFAPTANTVAANKGSNTFAGSSHLNSLRLKNTQDRLSFKVSAPCTVTFYTYSDASRGIYVGKTDNVSTDEAAYAKQPASTPKWEVSLDEAGVYYLSSYNGDFFFAGFEVVFPDDPAAVEFGFTRTVAAETSTSSDALVSDKYRVSDDIIVDPSVEGVTFSKNFGLQSIMTDKSRSTHWYNGTADQECYVDKLDKNYRTQFEKGVVPESAEAAISVTSLDERCYYGFDLTIAEGYKLSIVRIISDVLKDANNTHYQIKVYNNSSLIKTLEDVAVTNYTTSDMKRSVRVACDEDLQDLTGTVSVKMFFWNTGSTKYMVLKDFKVKAVVHSITSQTKTLKAIEVNGVDYDYATLGNTIDALYHAAPEVKFYYDVKNNWSDGSQTDAADENETIVASVSGDDYVAATTMLETPYSLTFTNIDLPKVFGITRVVANEKSNSTDMEDDGVTPKTQNKYAVAAISLVDPSDELVTVAIHNGTNQNALFNRSRSYTWNDGTEVKECFVDITVESNRTNANELDENQFFGFDLTIADYHKAQVMSITSDALLEAGRKDLKYIVKIYNGDALIATMEEVAADVNTGADMKRTIDLSGNAALKDLEGTITVKMFIYGNTGKYIIVKDLYVEVAVEKKAGEGVEGLVFTDFTPAPQPVFTEGEVTATWSNISNNVGPQTENRGIRMQGAYEYKMKVEVPADSYISEVVFVWNKKGNYYAGDEDPKRIIDLHILNSSEVEVDALEYRGDKVNETTWNCGDLRESELTFAQGEGGDIYVNSIRVTYLKKPATTTYVRTHTHMNLNTLCYPYQIDSYTGATFYTMLYKVVENTEVTEVVLQEHVGALEAGKPYFYVPEGTELVCNYSGDYTAAGNDGNGVYGSYTDMAAVTSGMYVTYNNQIIKAGNNVKLREYRAYINMDEVALQAVLAPGRRILRVGNADAPAVTTGAERIRTSEINGLKIIRNGQLFIIRDGKTYDIFGRLVD